MAITSIVRVSFQTGPTYKSAHSAVRMALVGHKTARTGPEPFTWVGTHLYQVDKGLDLAVSKALLKLSKVLKTHRKTLDFASISMFRKKSQSQSNPQPAPKATTQTARAVLRALYPRRRP